MPKETSQEFKDNMFKKGTSGNPKGRPKKFVSKVLDELLEKGEKVTRSTVVDIYQVMISLTKSDLVKMANDSTKPFIYRAVARNMVDKHKAFDVLETMLNRANGKPTTLKEVELKGSLQVRDVVFTSTNIKPVDSEADIKDHLN